MNRQLKSTRLLVLTMAFSMMLIVSDVYAQRGIQIGGPRGVRLGGGLGLRIGGNYGVRIGGGQGVIFGGQGSGVYLGGGQGARFGSPDYGLQFGQGRGIQAGPLYPYPNYVQPGAAYSQPLNQPGMSSPVASPTPVSPTANNSANVTNEPPPRPPTQPSDVQTGVQPAKDAAPKNENSTMKSVLEDQEPNLSSLLEPQTPTSSPRPQTDPTMIRLSLPDSANRAISYRLNGTSFSIQPGQSILMNGQQTWVIDFIPSPNAEPKSYTLDQPGEFEFTNLDAKLDLVKIAPQSTPESVKD